jgi:GR25 family glycosyltransferase involved in LPS biosynthesis
MKIDLLNIPKVWITTDEGTKRHKAMKAMFKRVGLNNCHKYSAPCMGKKGTKERNIGCTSGHLGANKMAEKLGLPVLVFEDDVEPTKWFWNKKTKTYNYNPIIEVPDDADAVYVGSSSWGQHGLQAYGESAEWQWIEKPIQFKPSGGHGHRSDVVRVTNMTAAHAIVIINPEYLLDCRKCQEQAIENGWWHDACLAQKLYKWNVYATTCPYFYQDDGKTLIEATNCSITDFMESKENYITSPDVLIEDKRRAEMLWEKSILEDFDYDMIKAREFAEKEKNYKNGVPPSMWQDDPEYGETHGFQDVEENLI